MATSSPGENQHFIPRFHLAQWGTSARVELELFDKRTGKFARRPAKRSAVVRDYYDLPDRPERRELELAFSKVEGYVAPLLRQLATAAVGTSRLANEDRIVLAAYASLLHVRVPAYRDGAQDRAHELTRDPDVIGLADRAAFLQRARSMGFPGTDDELDALRQKWLDELATGQRVVEVPASISLYPLAAAIEHILPRLIDRHWQVLRAAGIDRFVLGDQPVTVRSGDRLLPSIGFDADAAEVRLPLSPSSLLLISRQPREKSLQVTIADGGVVGLANRIAWLTAQQWVWAASRADLEATASGIPTDFLRRDLRILSPEDEAERVRIARERRRAHRDALDRSI
jgi:hypothetical protein